MDFKKLNNLELKELYRNLQGYFGVDEKYQPLVNLINKYFKNPASLLISVDSEYNDNTYDNKFVGVYVYDSKDVEIPLSRESRERFSIEVQDVHVSIPHETNEPLEDFVIYINKELPDLYIKVKNG